MCGIFAILKTKCGSSPQQYLNSIRDLTIRQSDTIKHRGPDWSGIYQDYKNQMAVSMGHERLSIIDPEHGAQPLVSHTKHVSLAVNGEIFNYQKLKEEYHDFEYKTNSDCEVILPLYQYYVDYLDVVMRSLDGVFAFVLYDKIKNQVLTARDPIGVNPLYYGFTRNGEICFASELKALHDICAVIHEFPPGHYCLCTENGGISFHKYYNPLWDTLTFNPDTNQTIIENQINKVLTNAVRKRLMSDVPFGVLLSGGLDSSLIASIASRLVKESGTKFGNKIHSFSVGISNSPDVLAAKKVAKYIDSIHHTIYFTVEEGMDAIKKVIYHLETYDRTTIRASTPMFLLSRAIKSHGIKMVLSGEGADEIFGGYLYFHKAPTNQDFHNECLKLIKRLHYFDCNRANKSTMAWGLEGRFPFLDKQFLETCVPIHPELKCMQLASGKKSEKYILRSSFQGYLPDEILWRQKEQFSDGVGYSWIDYLIDTISNEKVTDEDMELASHLYPYNTPRTKEDYYYRKVFEEYFPNGRSAETVSQWIPETKWDGVDEDPSGRSQGVHDSHQSWQTQ